MKMYGAFIKVYIYSLLEYRFLFFMDIILQIITYGLSLGSTWILLNQFGNVMGWSFPDLLLLFSFDMISYALAGMFFKHPMLDMEEMIRTGEFDTIMTKPLNTLFHVVARQFQHGFIGHTILCIFSFSYCFIALNIAFTPLKILFFILIVLGATLIQAAFMIFSGGLCFFFVKSTAVVETAIYSIRSFLVYPITIYSKAIQVLLTFIIPYAFVNFYPAEFFIMRDGSYLFTPLFQFLTPIIGVALFALAILFWNFGVKNYNSTGN